MTDRHGPNKQSAEPKTVTERTDRAIDIPANDLTRRSFLRTSALGGLAAGVTSVSLATGCGDGEYESSHPTASSSQFIQNTTQTAATSQSSGSGIQRRVVLGKSGLEVPDISFGSFALEHEHEEDLVRYAFDQGITHFDTAEGYNEGRAEKVIGNALRGQRDKATITSKFWATPEHDADHQMRILERSLRALQTDYIDLYMNHAVNDVARVASEEWQRFTDKAKQQGKIRTVGMSGHAARLSDCLEYVLDHNLVDVVLVAYSFAQQPSFKDSVKQYLNEWVPSLDIVSSNQRLPEILERAHGQGVGVMAMKTLKGARMNDMRPFEGPGRTFAQSAFRWVLSEPSVDGLVVTMTSPEMIDEYVAASGSGAPDGQDLALLARYAAINAGTSCLIGCGDCLDSCPASVPIADVMRMRMYDLDYGQPTIAAREYAGLDIDASACLGCSGEPCATACSSGLAIPDLTRDTALRLGRTA